MARSTHRNGRKYSGFSGRASVVPVGHGSWKHDSSCYSRVSKSWKPLIETLGNANACPNPWGPYGPGFPPNISEDTAGYNTKLWRNYADVGHALRKLGYRGENGNNLVRAFQMHWNRVSSHVMANPDRYKSVMFAVVPEGFCLVDAEPGPQTLNALEIALKNQERSVELSWQNMLKMVASGPGYGREKLYNAAQGGWSGAIR